MISPSNSNYQSLGGQFSRQDLGLQDGVSIRPLPRRRLHPTRQQDAGAPRGDQAACTTPGSAAILAARPWLARRRLHPPQPPPAGCWRSQGRSGSTHDSRERRHLGGTTLACKTAPPPNPPASRMLALPGAIGQHARLPGAPPSWRHDLGLQDGASTPQPPPAGCWRSQGRSGSMHDSRERRHLGGITLACKTASPPPTASRMLALPWAIGQHARLPGAPPSWRQDLRPSTYWEGRVPCGIMSAPRG